jgi:hypothetical protein
MPYSPMNPDANETTRLSIKIRSLPSHLNSNQGPAAGSITPDVFGSRVSQMLMSPRNKLHRRNLPEAFAGQSDVATGFGYGSFCDEDEKETKTRHGSNRASQVPIAMHLGTTGRHDFH